jgi:extracellular factor (EF) 3-hydroxypalmitic acid methyl ester biosynthesis protein
VVIADMHSLLAELQRWLEQVELGIRAAPAGDRQQLEREALRQLSGPMVKEIDVLFERFELVALQVPEEQHPAHQAFMQRLLHPLVLLQAPQQQLPQAQL